MGEWTPSRTSAPASRPSWGAPCGPARSRLTSWSSCSRPLSDRPRTGATMNDDPRPLEERLAEYRDSMGFTAPQLQDIIDRLPVGADPTPLQDAIKFYTQVSLDL